MLSGLVRSTCKVTGLSGLDNRKNAIKYPVIALLAFLKMLAPPLKCPSQGVKRDGTHEELTRKEKLLM